MKMRILAIGIRKRNKYLQRHEYTLTELVSVTAILFIVLGIVATSMVLQPAFLSLEQEAVKLSKSGAECRRLAIIHQKTMTISYNPGDHSFLCHNKVYPLAQKTKVKKGKIDFHDTEILFSFFPDGTAVSNGTVLLEQEDRQIKIFASPLTGVLQYKEPE